jgi:hypothetical protein
MTTRFAMGRRLAALIPLAQQRAVRGAELAAGGHVHPVAGSIYLVDGSAGALYAVDLATGSCNCPDGHAPHDDQGAEVLQAHVCGTDDNRGGVGRPFYTERNLYHVSATDHCRPCRR